MEETDTAASSSSAVIAVDVVLGVGSAAVAVAVAAAAGRPAPGVVVVATGETMGLPWQPKVSCKHSTGNCSKSSSNKSTGRGRWGWERGEDEWKCVHNMEKWGEGGKRINVGGNYIYIVLVNFGLRR